MPTPVYEDVADYLVTLGLGVKGTTLFGGNLPATPDTLTALFEHPGHDPELAMGRIAQDVVNLQVLTRALKSVDARTKAFAIRDALYAFNMLPLASRVLNGVQYHSIIPRSAPFPVGLDENNRQRWSCNYIVRKNP